MRIISSYTPLPQRQTIEPVERIADRTDRRSAPDRRLSPRPMAAPVPTAPQVTHAGVVAQAVFHTSFEGRPEGSATHADRAYRRTEEMQFRYAEPLSEVA